MSSLSGSVAVELITVIRKYWRDWLTGELVRGATAETQFVSLDAEIQFSVLVSVAVLPSEDKA